MKRPLLFIILVIFFVILTLVVVRLIIFTGGFDFNRNIEIEKNWSYYNKNFENSILNKLKYKIRYQHYPYKQEKYNIIFCKTPITKHLLDDYKNWLGKGKRLIVFYIRTKENESYVNNYSAHLSMFNLKINSTDILFNDVDFLWINRNTELNLDDKEIFNNNTEPLIESEGKILIAREKYNEGEIIYISDNFLFSDISIMKSNNAVFLNNLLKDYCNEKIVYDYYVETDNVVDQKNQGFSSDYFLFKEIFLLILLQLILIAIVFFFTFFKRFGAPIDKEIFKRRSLIRHLEACGYFFEKAKNPIIFLDILDRYFIDRLRTIIKIRSSSTASIIAEVKKRYFIPDDYSNIFTLNNKLKSAVRENKREKFIRKLKGIEKR